MHWGYGPAWGWPGMLTAVVLMLLFWGGLIALTLLLARFARGWRTESPGRQSLGAPNGGAEWILAERFARGEIDEDTYRRQREVLRADERL